MCQRISVAEYEAQAREFSKREVERLADEIRRDPRVSEATFHYSLSTHEFEKREAALVLVLSALLTQATAVFLIFTKPNDRGALSLLDQLMEALEHKDEGGRVFSLLTSHPSAALILSIMSFLLWISLMHLKNKKVQQIVTSEQQLAVVLGDYIVLPFMGTMSAVLAALHFTKWLQLPLMDYWTVMKEGLLVNPVTEISLEGAAEAAKAVSLLVLSSDELLIALLTCVIYTLTVWFILNSMRTLPLPVNVLFGSFIFGVMAYLVWSLPPGEEGDYSKSIQSAGRWWIMAVICGFMLNALNNVYCVVIAWYPPVESEVVETEIDDIDDEEEETATAE